MIEVREMWWKTYEMEQIVIEMTFEIFIEIEFSNPFVELIFFMILPLLHCSTINIIGYVGKNQSLTFFFIWEDSDESYEQFNWSFLLVHRGL